MKQLSIFFFLLMGLALNAQSAVQTLFKQYETDKTFTTVYISEYMFGMLADMNTDGGEDQDILELSKGLKELVVLTTEKDGMKHYEAAKKTLGTSSYKTLMSVRDEEENVQILAKEDNKKISELLVLVGSPDEFVLVSLTGEIDLAKISKLAKQTELKGLEHLEKVGN